jgi:hypothetical protein
MRSVRIALAASGVVLAVTVAAVLSRSPAVVAGSNGVPATGRAELELPGGDTSSCQPVGIVPWGTSAVRISIGAGAGPRVHVRVLSEGRVATQGELPAGWGLEAAATVPVRPLKRELHNALVCTSLGPDTGPLKALGVPRRSTSEGTRLSEIELRVEYLRPGSDSWWSRASSIAYRVGLGRAVSGTWIAFLALALMIAVGALGARVVLADLR